MDVERMVSKGKTRDTIFPIYQFLSSGHFELFLPFFSTDPEVRDYSHQPLLTIDLLHWKGNQWRIYCYFPYSKSVATIPHCGNYKPFDTNSGHYVFPKPL